MIARSVLRTEAVEVADLVRWITEGRVRIPRFQRGLRWGFNDVRRLFDSIARDYPIGNLLLWEQPVAEADVEIGALRFHAPGSSKGLLVVDGQQRLASLANVLGGAGLDDPRYALSYDTRKEQFVRYQKDDPTTIPLPTVFDGKKLLAWFASRPDAIEMFDAASDLGTRIRQYKVPVYTVEESDEATLRDIFDRMNTYGKPLSRADVFSAIYGTRTGERNPSDKNDFSRVAESVHEATGFGILDDSTVLLCYLARRGKDTSREIRIEFSRDADRDADIRVIDERFRNESQDAALDGAREAIIAAVTFLQKEAFIPHVAFLPYSLAIVVLTRFFAHHSQPADASLRDLRRFVWRSAEEKDSGTAAIRRFTSLIDPDDEYQSVHRVLVAINRPAPFVLDRFQTNGAATRIALCALWHAHPGKIDAPLPDQEEGCYTIDDLRTALGEASTANSITARILPGARWSTEAGNRLLLPERALTGRSLFPDLVLLARQAHVGDSVAAALLDSHLVRAPARELLRAEDQEGFVTRRTDDILSATQDFLKSRTEWDFEATPPLSDFEVEDADLGDRDDTLVYNPAQPEG